MNLGAIQQFYDYNYWAHRRVWQCVQQLTEEKFLQPLDYSVGSIRNQLVHTMSYEWVYLTRMKDNTSPAMLIYDDFPTREAIYAHWQVVERDLREFINSLDETSLNEFVDYFSVGGQPYRNTRLQLLQHLANHSTDHRAQILAMLNLLGAETQPQDFIYYLRDNDRM